MANGKIRDSPRRRDPCLKIWDRDLKVLTKSELDSVRRKPSPRLHFAKIRAYVCSAQFTCVLNVEHFERFVRRLFLLFHWASFQATSLSLLFFPDHAVLCKSGKVLEIHTLRAPMFSLYISSISYLALRCGYFSTCAHIFTELFFASRSVKSCEVLHGKSGMLPTNE